MAIDIKYDGEISIAVGKGRKELNWKNQDYLWSDFVKKISITNRTHETYNEYIAMQKSRQDEIKDVGGFVGGTLSGGRRKHDNVMGRSLMALDIDFGTKAVWDMYLMLYGNAGLIYSTHKHTPQKCRLRLVVPFSREILKDEYEPIARKFANDLGINNFDDTTFEPSRLMYWPSTSKDAEYFFNYCDGEWLNPDDILKTYRDWRDSSSWPQSDRVQTIIQREIKKQGDPLEKPGLIGAFCRTYSITEAIDSFLQEEYEPCENGRYTYKHGSTTAGLVIYEDKFAYSHHGTDPTSGKLCNAFDLVRLHKFGLRDEDAKEGTAPNRLPSFTAMTDFCRNDNKTKRQLGMEKLADAKGDFSDINIEDDLSWHELLDIDSKGKIMPTIDNVVIILENDTRLKNKLALNLAEHREVLLGKLEWRKDDDNDKLMRDDDEQSLRRFFQKQYEITGKSCIEDALGIVVRNNSFHPIKDYLNSCIWDETPRLDTLFIDYLGAKDTELVRLMTRKAFTAAVARVYNPGCKYDYVLTLVGKQGIGKSTILKKMGREWYSDSLDTVVGKDAYELLQGVWLVEMGELAGLKKAEINQIKHFITKQEDRYRVAYGKRTSNFPRQCVFFGTTNNGDFINDPTGGRRWWPIDTMEHEPTKNIFTDLDDYEIDQIWAEAIHFYKKGEKLFLPKDLEDKAAELQNSHTEVNEKSGLIEAYLDLDLPENWGLLDVAYRQSYVHNKDVRENLTQGLSTFKRDRVCVAEIWCELFRGQSKDLNGYNSRELHAIMRNMPGWKEHSSKVGKLRFDNYGMQRAYVKV